MTITITNEAARLAAAANHLRDAELLLTGYLIDHPLDEAAQAYVVQLARIEEALCRAAII